jgi:GDPmannose 4,6-dehydratase
VKTVLITGITGQDGSYLAERLLEEQAQVIGTVRNLDSVALPTSLSGQVELIELDLHDTSVLMQVLTDHHVDEIYNFAAFSSGEGMFAQPVEIGDVNGLGVARILESIRTVDPTIRFCQASSSEMFGYPLESPQNEDSMFHPRTPYGSAKLYAHSMIDIYRRRYGLFACSAILYNHESPRRGLNFVTRKVVRAAAAIKLGLAKEVTLGTLDACRDWGYAKDYVQAMRLMLQQEHADDYVIATGVVHSIRDLCKIAFGHVGLDFQDHVRVIGDDQRAPDSLQLVGDASKARRALGWSPTVDFEQMIKLMVEHELHTVSPDGVANMP